MLFETKTTDDIWPWNNVLKKNQVQELVWTKETPKTHYCKNDHGKPQANAVEDITSELIDGVWNYMIYAV